MSKSSELSSDELEQIAALESLGPQSDDFVPDNDGADDKNGFESPGSSAPKNYDEDGLMAAVFQGLAAAYAKRTDPKWAMCAEEAASLGQCMGAVLNKWFPVVANTPEGALGTAAAGYLLSRLDLNLLVGVKPVTSEKEGESEASKADNAA